MYSCQLEWESVYEPWFDALMFIFPNPKILLSWPLQIANRGETTLDQHKKSHIDIEASFKRLWTVATAFSVEIGVSDLLQTYIHTLSLCHALSVTWNTGA